MGEIANVDIKRITEIVKITIEPLEEFLNPRIDHIFSCCNSSVEPQDSCDEVSHSCSSHDLMNRSTQVVEALNLHLSLSWVFAYANAISFNSETNMAQPFSQNRTTVFASSRSTSIGRELGRPRSSECELRCRSESVDFGIPNCSATWRTVVFGFCCKIGRASCIFSGVTFRLGLLGFDPRERSEALSLSASLSILSGVRRSFFGRPRFLRTVGEVGSVVMFVSGTTLGRSVAEEGMDSGTAMVVAIGRR